MRILKNSGGEEVHLDQKIGIDVKFLSIKTSQQQQHKRRHSSLPHLKLQTSFLFCPKRKQLLLSSSSSSLGNPSCEIFHPSKSAMISHLYAIDSQSKAQELASTILNSSSPSTISSACTAIESFLQKHTVDQIRFFFSIAFPSLICKIFGFDESSSSSSSDKSHSSSWIDQINGSNDLELAGKVYNLLSPNGILFSSITSVDRHSLVKYVFPIERLPEWSRFLLQNERDFRVLSDLCPLFKGRIKEDSSKGCYQVQLNVFEYYMFWFAYYPVCKGNSENSDVVVVRKTRRFRLENWTTSIPILSGAHRGGLGKKTECSLYIRLLYAYLRAYVPNYGSTAHQPYRSSLLHYSSGFDGSALLQVEFVVHTLIHFWLVDNDFSPLPVSVCKSFGVSFPLRAVLGETPPTSGMGEVVMLFMKYLNSSFAALKQEYEVVEQSGSPRWRVSGGSVDVVKSKTAILQSSSSVASWNSLIQRPMYRFILRTFLFCPMGTSIKNASQVFSLWISYMEPWKISLEDFVELEALIDPSTGNSRNEKSPSSVKNNDGKKNGQSAQEYTSSWQAYVLSNYLFYSSLVMHFLGFAHKFLHTDPETIIQMVSKVLTILTSSRELMDLLKKVDAAFHSKQALPSSPRFDNLYKCVPSIREQLQDWEEGLCESDADGSFLHANWNQDLRLLSDGADGGYQLLQLLILRAESEIQAIAGDLLSQNLQMLDSLKADMGHLFGAHVERPRSVTPDTKQTQHSRDELFKPRWVGNQSFADVKYKGDWMKRPASDGEVAWLANLMVRLSDYLNKILGLHQGQNSNTTGPAWSYVDVSNNEMSKVGGPKEAMKMLVSCVGSWLVLVGVSLVKFMREHGLRLNLRVFASKKVLMVLLLTAVFSFVKKAFGMFSHSQLPV